MKYIFICLCVLLLSGLSEPIVAQHGPADMFDSIFDTNTEVYFTFNLDKNEDIHALTRLISIDHIDGKTVYAYANKKEFADFLLYDLEYKILPHPGTLLSKSEITAACRAVLPGDQNIWDFYPTYQQYVDYMVGCAIAHPDICKLDTVGYSIEGRLILALKISKNVRLEEGEPQILFTSSIHGDEMTGYILMLHLIDYLISEYEIDPNATEIVNSTEICINPLANPDGTFHGGNNSVYGAVRYNANGIDLNRNFPDPRVGDHPDNNGWQPETEAWMAYSENNHFSMAVNFHGGAEVFNYPWDTWSTLCTDDDWWQFVGREWADTVHKYCPSGYFDDLDNGITNGYAWYEITGGRQDYMNYWHNCREVTVEISNIKLLPTNQLLAFWNYNYRSFLNFIKQSHYGFHGTVSDTVNNRPIAAKVFINDHDKDSSQVFSRSATGYYSRPVFEGIYNVTFSAPGYFSKIIQNVNVSKWASTKLDVQLRPLTYDIQDKSDISILVYPNPSDGHFRLTLPGNFFTADCFIRIINTMGCVIYSSPRAGISKNSTIDIAAENLPDGIYYIKFNNGYKIFLHKLLIKR